MRRLSVLLIVLVLVAGCRAGASTGSPVPVGSSSQRLEVGGTTRTYHLYRPAGLPAAAPLVIFLHGGFGSGTQAEKEYGWDAQADAGHFLVAYPDGENRAWDTGGGCCGTPGSTGVDDVAFLTAMVGAIGARVPLDTHRIYATGISNGGIMAYTMACRTTLLAAIGPDSATQLGDCVAPAPLSVIHVHGTADRNIPYDGGTGAGVARIDGPAVPDLNATWRGIDRCDAPTVTVAGAVTTSRAACPGGRAVELVAIAGAGHQWPGSAAKPVIQRLLGTDPPATEIDATQVIWTFFSEHPQPAA
jgi:polyhydroxybutyrate depolymerase